jgi:dipeptidase
MCDTLIGTPAATARGAMLFGKNSDRERNEAQPLQMLPARRHGRNSRVRLTYVEIDEAPETHACLISRPFWMWGAEMGANEHGVVIGNEAMHSTVAAQRRRALTGMDLVRLGLERGATAAEAVSVMTELLERHGQGGDCGHLGRFYYHNGFVIADPREAYVLETVDRWWAVERVEGVRSLSNALSIGRNPEAMSVDLLAQADAAGWLDADGRFDFAERLIDPVRDAGSFGRGRCARATSLLAPKAGRIGLADIQALLRDHGAEADGDPDWTPAKTTHRSICMHAATGARRSQTVASMTSDLTPGAITHWVTGTAAPCLSLFKPVVVGMALPDTGPAPSDHYDGESLWWRHERLHRAALDDFPAALALIAGERDTLEAGFRARMDAAWANGDAGVGVGAAIAACWREAETAETRWRRAVAGARRGPSSIGRSAALAWARLNSVAGFPGG